VRNIGCGSPPFTEFKSHIGCVEAAMDMPDSDFAYFRMREKRERELAAAAQLEHVRNAHLALAEKYSSLVKVVRPST